MHAPTPERLIELLAQKLALLEQLRALGRRQAEFIGAGDMGTLLKVLAAKQHCLAAMQPVERELADFRHDDPALRVWRTPQDREHGARLVAACERLLAEIVETEAQSERDLVGRRDEAAAQLQGLYSSDFARGAYTVDPIAAAGQLDLASES